MQVLGVGFGRTGTLSMKEALDELGFGPCYHMTEAMRLPGHKRLWVEAAESATGDVSGSGDPLWNGVAADPRGGSGSHQGRRARWDRLFEGYRSTVDWPGCYFWRELVEDYPDAKVILTDRDPEKWYASTHATIYRLGARLAPVIGWVFPPGRGMARLTRTLIWKGTFDGRFSDQAYAIEVFQRHLDEVKAEVPADRLLVFDVREGWEPLCEFLGVNVPDKPFPHVNDRESMEARIRRLQFGLGVAGAAVTGLTAAAVVRLVRRRRA